MSFLSISLKRVSFDELPDDFDEEGYLRLNADVAGAVRDGKVESGAFHWLLHGRQEGRIYRPRNFSQGELEDLSDSPPSRPSGISAKAQRRARSFKRKRWILRVAFTGFRFPFRRSIASHFRHVVRLAAEQSVRQAQARPETGHGPLISFVVPIFNTKQKHLDDLLASFLSQPSELCELILSDDGSTSPETRAWLDKIAATPGLTTVRSAENHGIAAATNQGIARAAGAWVGLLDHDDALAPFAVLQIAKALGSAPECQFLYTDEIIANGRLRPVDYFLKPAWDEVLLSGVNYINHLSLYRRSRVLKIGGLRDGFQGSQDYDLLLRYTAGLRASEILHLPYPAYLWRRHGGSFSTKHLESATANARRAIGEAYATDARPAQVGPALAADLHRLRFDLERTEWPLVSVIIPNRDALLLVSKLLEGLTAKTDYPALEIIVVDNGSKSPEVLALYENYRRSGIEFTASIKEEHFNFSSSVNRGIGLAKGDLILLLNNDIEILHGNWLKEMVSCLDYPGTGIVGAKLLYPNGTLQHAGVIAGLGGLAGHWFIGRNESFPGPMGRLRVRQSLSAVTAACMLITRSCIERVGLFDETTFGIAYNDVDYCLRAITQGFRVVWTPFATLLHHESASRGSDEAPDKIARFRKDQQSLRTRHRTDIFEDRAFNPWYSKHHSEPKPVFLKQLPGAR